MKSQSIRLLAIMLLPLVGGCSALVSRATDSLAQDLTTAMLNQEDPALVRDAVPAYLVMLDSFVERNPESVATLTAAAQLYSAYGTAFVNDPERARRLTARSREYGARALCARRDNYCGLGGLPFGELELRLAETRAADADVLYSFAVGWLAYIRAHSSDWVALGELPNVEALLVRIQSLDPHFEEASVHLYLGILNSLRPPALGGQPEVGRGHFEKAIALTGGRDLSAKLEFARGYARLVYDRPLHDQLLQEVLAAEPRAPRLTLTNVMAQDDARALLESADDYF